MKYIKNILLLLCFLFVVGTAIFTYVGFKSASFRDEHSPFVKKFMTEISQDWDIADVQHMIANDFREQMKTPNARQAMLIFSKLGKVTNIHDIELKNSTTKAGPHPYSLGEFVFKTDFENASGVVTLTVIVKDNGEKVHGLHITPTTDIKPVPTKTNI